MRYRTLGKTGLRVSEIGFGAWAMGGGMWGGTRDQDSKAAMSKAHELGLNFIDTALVYGDGHSERLVGEFVKQHRDVAVATKVPPKNYSWPAYPKSKLKDFFPAAWIRDCAEKSLRNLKLDHIDLLQLHVWADNFTDELDWLEAFSALKKEGKIRFAGISINSHDPKSAVRVAASGHVDALQVFYNIFDQSPEDELFPTCIEHGVGILARVPLDEGSLTGKLRYDTTFPEGDFRNQYFAGSLLKETVDRVEKLRPLVEREAATMARGALRYCLSHPAVSLVIPGMRSSDQAADNCAASDDGPLSAAAVEELHTHRWVRSPYNS